MAMKFKDGVVLGADSRTSTGSTGRVGGMTVMMSVIIRWLCC